MNYDYDQEKNTNSAIIFFRNQVEHGKQLLCIIFLQMLQIVARTTSLQVIQINFPNNALVIFANHVLDTFLQIVVPDYLYANFANCCSVQPFCNLSFSTIYFLQNVANVLFLTLHLKFGSKLSMGLYGAFWAPCDTKQSYAIRGLRHGPICCCSVSVVFWAPSGTKQSYAILGLRHDPICCCSLSVVWLKLWQNIFRYFGWAKFWRKGMIVKVSEIFVTKNVILKTIYTRYDFEFCCDLLSSLCLRKESQVFSNKQSLLFALVCKWMPKSREISCDWNLFWLSNCFLGTFADITGSFESESKLSLCFVAVLLDLSWYLIFTNENFPWYRIVFAVETLRPLRC